MFEIRPRLDLFRCRGFADIVSPPPNISVEAFSPSKEERGGGGGGGGGEYWIFLPVNQLGAGEEGAGKGTIAKEERKKFTYPLLS